MAFTRVFLSYLRERTFDFLNSADGYDNIALGEGSGDANETVTPVRRSNTALDTPIAGSKKSLVWNYGSPTIVAIQSWTDADFVDKKIGEVALQDSGDNLMRRWILPVGTSLETFALDCGLWLRVTIHISVTEEIRWE